MRPPKTPPRLRTWTLSDGYVMQGRVWGGGDPDIAEHGRELVLYLHGIQSHGGWFERSAAELAAPQRVVLLPDRRGSGLNAAERGDVAHWRRWLDDLDELLSCARRDYEVERVSVVGVSWGGKLALSWLCARRPAVERVVLIAPGLAPAVDVSRRTKFQIVRALLTDPRRLFPIPLNDPALFTDSPAARGFIEEDPLKLTHATARFLYHSRNLDRLLSKEPPGAITAECHLFLAGRERIVRNAPTEALVRKLVKGSPNVRFFPTARHTLEFEEDGVGFLPAFRGVMEKQDAKSLPLDYFDV